MRPQSRQLGFTLIEMIVVIVITGIIGGMVAVFLKAPIQQYMDVSRRAELTDIADMAIRRIGRDVRTAVPNSVRIAGCGGIPCVEFLPSKDGGRYRVAGGDTLVFDGADTTFDALAAVDAVAGDSVVIGSTQSDGGVAYDAGVAGGLRGITAVSGVNVTLASGLPSTAELAAHRFAVVGAAQQAVTYACETPGVDAAGNGTGVLRRYWRYGFNGAQLNPPVGGSSALLADKVSACQIEYEVPAMSSTSVLPRFGLLVVRLTLTSGGESVSLYNEIHVNNAP